MNENLENTEKKKKRGRSKGEYYVSNDELINEICIYNTTGVFTYKLSKIILRIAEGLSKSPNFINYSYIDEMKGDAIFRMCKAVTDKICDIKDISIIGTQVVDEDGKLVYENVLGEEKPILHEQNNIFGYFSRIAWRSFQNRINLEKKYSDTRQRYTDEICKLFEENYGISANEVDTENN